MALLVPFAKIANADVRMRDAFGSVRILKQQPNNNWTTVVKIDAKTFQSLETATRARALIEREMEGAGAATNNGSHWLISIPPVGPIGFDIDLSKSDSYIRASFGGLETDFETYPRAMIWVERALSDAYRLSILVAGKHPYGWKLSSSRPTGATDTLAAGHVTLFNTFRRSCTIVRQNAFAAGPGAV